jgi:hypothetical protein
MVALKREEAFLILAKCINIIWRGLMGVILGIDQNDDPKLLVARR